MTRCPEAFLRANGLVGPTGQPSSDRVALPNQGWSVRAFEVDAAGYLTETVVQDGYPGEESDG